MLKNIDPAQLCNKELTKIHLSKIRKGQRLKLTNAQFTDMVAKGKLKLKPIKKSAETCSKVPAISMVDFFNKQKAIGDSSQGIQTENMRCTTRNDRKFKDALNEQIAEIHGTNPSRRGNFVSALASGNEPVTQQQPTNQQITNEPKNISALSQEKRNIHSKDSLLTTPAICVSANAHDRGSDLEDKDDGT